ncbi:acetolactate decarboxylase [Pontibacter cellulosilyticus]|uniref:Acetolactate decarboxylase n=1 Tax=Pontibacter cellulosilyticus TaxID=1720253 RepID=A0A923SI67_9BACT|nr:acetolactate decarboxylase [Pontibacter cellulosilyticus]MBC5991331.1 acetolactate decarboxylase [Pontibacter cellulosilyticus]
MINRYTTLLIILASTLSFTSCSTSDNQNEATIATASPVEVSGAMRNVMWKGELHGTIALDTIANKEHLYGLGPVENLAGELLIMDGKIFKSTVVSDATMKVDEVQQAKAPFFVYGNVPAWQEQALPDSIQSIKQLETYLDQVSKNSQRPFAFRLKGEVENATIHVLNLPAGTQVSSPDEAHQGLQNYNLVNEQVEIVGFFSTEHKAVFTHHDTYLHMHLVTADETQMGHLDKVKLKSRAVKLYLPASNVHAE